jgi:hypothetical protein
MAQATEGGRQHGELDGHGFARVMNCGNRAERTGWLSVRQRHRQALAEEFPEGIWIRRPCSTGASATMLALAAPLLDAQVHEIEGAGQFPAA